MPRRRSERAQRRIAERTRRNALALEAAVAIEEERPLRPKWARHKTQLEFLEGRGSITTRQHAAGDRLYLDFSRAGDLPQVVARYEQNTGRPDRGQIAFRDWTPGQVQARERFEQAMQAVGLLLLPIVMHVCICDLPLGDWRRAGMRNGDGAALLRLALDGLADHYRLPDADGVIGRINGGAADLSSSNAASRVSQTVTAPLTVASQ
jgi:hypothetical protein